jgi:hypothetical protein
MDRSATVRQQTVYVPVSSNLTYAQPDWVNFDFDGGGLAPTGTTLYQAFTGTVYPVAAPPSDVTPAAAGVETPFAGRGTLYQLAYGRYVIAMNMSSSLTYTVYTPLGNNSTTTELVNGTTHSPGTSLSLGPLNAFVWDLGGLPPQLASASLNAGGSAVGNFSADADYSGGTAGGGTTSAITTTGINNPAPQNVYRTERFGNITYTVTGLNTALTYTVRLHFAEIYWTASGKRTFNVAINGTTVLSTFDIYATAGGQFIAVVEEFTATPTSSGAIVITFTTVLDNAKISGIEVLPRTVAINSGGSTTGNFLADMDYSGGAVGGGTTSTITTSNVNCPAPQTVYQTERLGNMTYAIPGLVAGKQYTVRLHFAEIYWTASGKRTFNVLINSLTLLHNFDIYAAAGGVNIANVQEFAATATSSGQITIQLVNVVDNAKISGIEIVA